MSHPDSKSERDWFKRLFELSPDPAWIIDGNRFVECNEAAIRVLGYANREEFLNVHPSRLSPPKQPDGQDSYSKAESMMAIAKDKGLHRFEWIHTKADGTNFVAEVTLSVINPVDGQAIYCVWRDITERKKIEQQLRVAATAFESRESMVITDADSVILKVNQAFTEATGYTAEEAVGRTPRILKSGRH
ncbi:MAG: PAS domain S-box protein, partial [Sideroxydans sp.]